MVWKIRYYVAQSVSPVEDFVFSLDQVAKSKLVRQLQGLRVLGPQMRMPLVRQLGGGLYELRIRGKQEIRIIYCFSQDMVVLLHGFIKKTNKTPERHLCLARDRQRALHLL